MDDRTQDLSHYRLDQAEEQVAFAKEIVSAIQEYLNYDQNINA